MPFLLATLAFPRMRLVPLAAFVAVLGLSLPNFSARADDAAPSGTPLSGEQAAFIVKEKISGLEWTEKARIIGHGKAGTSGSERFAASLSGHYQRPGWTLSMENQVIKPDDQGKFTYETPVSREDTTVQLIAVGPFGEVERQSVTFQFSKWRNQRDDGTGAFAKRLFVTPGLSITSFSHKETNNSDYHSIALTAKASVNYLLFPPRWDLGATAFFTVFQFTKPAQITFTDSGLSVPDVSVHYLGLNLRLGYIFPQVQDPWRLSLYGGFYYTTMFVNPKLFGFQNLSGPQLYPSLRRNFAKGDALVGYVKYSPISSNFSLLNFSNREFATGAAYIFKKNQAGHAFSTSMDYSNIQFQLGGIHVTTTTFSVGGGYGF